MWQVRHVVSSGDAGEAREARVRIVRYMVLSWIFSLRKLSRPILRRFTPTDKFSDASLRQKLAALNFDPCMHKLSFHISILCIF